VIPWENSSCVAVHTWQWGRPRGCMKGQRASAGGQLENDFLSKWVGKWVGVEGCWCGKELVGVGHC